MKPFCILLNYRSNTHTHVPSRISYALSNGILGLTWCRRVLLNFRKSPRICFVKSDFLSCWKQSRKSQNTVFVYSKSEYTKIGQCVRPSVRPSVYLITLHNYIRLIWNFVHRIVLSISRSSSKMRRIRQEMAELSKKLSFLIRPSLRGSTGIFEKKKFSELSTTYINRLSF